MPALHRGAQIGNGIRRRVQLRCHRVVVVGGCAVELVSPGPRREAMSADALSATLTTIVPLADANCASVPSVHVTVPPERLHRLVVGVATSAETKVTPGSSVAVSLTFVVSVTSLLATDQL